MTSRLPSDGYDDLRQALGDPELDPELLERALTHRSYAYENGNLPTNERLEFLGDSVLGVVVTETLYLAHPDLHEGKLAKLRAAVVNARALAEVARTVGLGEHVKLGRGEEITGGRGKDSILSDTVEAVIGAIYLSGGFEAAGKVVHLLFDPLMATAAEMGAGLDWKTSLQELAAERSLGVPEYVIEDSGPDHAKTFTAQVRVGGARYGHGTGRSKKEAEQQAAETAYLEILEATGPARPARAADPGASPADEGDAGRPTAAEGAGVDPALVDRVAESAVDRTGLGGGHEGREVPDPDLTEPDPTEPDPTERDGKDADVSEPEATKPETPRAEVSKDRRQRIRRGGAAAPGDGPSSG